MARYHWIAPITVCVVASVLCCGDDDEKGESVPDPGSTVQCTEGAIKYTTSSGEIVCCPSANRFCDENADGYTGGCWPENTDCNLITQCGGQWAACPTGSLPYCKDDATLECHVCSEGSSVYRTASGKPVCCDSDAPTFCDETDEGYAGGCWASGVDCDTIAPCGDDWAACAEGMVVVCDEATGEGYCTQA
ncbi:MAG: hypothetical protein JXA30_01980 [Deltaproteobacteria bacterium]|nr:hypothetical protein [Deltaproteobacteria bacterium]